MDSIKVQRAIIGLFFSGVKLSTGDGGICFTPVKEIPEAVCCPSSASAMPNSGRLTGQPVTDYIERAEKGGPLQKALGIAVLNALSSTCWRKNPPTGYSLTTGIDPVENKKIKEDAVVVVIGALVPYIRMLKQRGRPFYILEKDSRTLKADEMQYFQPPEKAQACISSADLLIITGTTLINNTLEEILKQKRSDAEVILVGPTASMLPEAFFNRGISSIGGIMVTDPDKLLYTLSEGGSGYHFYGKSADRLVIEKV
ncbi:MAG: DUF364 domain-containing protein [Deltaproteobacteria bacterium]|nr:DUF364 domain-containing protein [Deltaproteobacteria bacterium]